ncbi:hypothetical protein ABW20_dc0108949 [Dactylellina cionopaga]|nr:hypothetical protein ABW20_dc0108949 [Dactylellina cionopaga]
MNAFRGCNHNFVDITIPPPPLPPKYFECKPGGREEFFKDLEAYQVAAQIHAQHAQVSNSAPSTAQHTGDHEAPSYDSIGEVALPTIHETKVFKNRLLTTLRAMRDFIEVSRRTPKWSNCFGFSDKVQIVLVMALLVALVGAIVCLAVFYLEIAGLVALAVFLVVHAASSYFVIRKYFLKKHLIESLQIVLAKVERFEKIDDLILKRLIHGVSATLSPIFWIRSVRRMEEAIPEETRVVIPPPIHVDIPPPPTTPPPAHEDAGRTSTTAR